MILNLLKNFILALLLDAGAALAFGVDEPTPAAAAPQSCAVPVTMTAETTVPESVNLSATGTRS